MSTIKIALIQKNAVPNNPDRNLELAIQYIEEASSMAADIVLFPEMWSNGYAPPFEGAFDNPFNHDFEKERKEWLEKCCVTQKRLCHRNKRYCCKMQDWSLHYVFIKDR